MSINCDLLYAVNTSMLLLNKSQKAEKKRNGIDGLNMISGLARSTTAATAHCVDIRRMKLDELNNLRQ